MKTTKIERDIRLTHDCVGEFTVPDYLPEVEKLLSAECALSSDGLYLKPSGSSGITAEQSGEVAFEVVWQGGESAAPTGAVFRCDYDNTAVLGAFPPGVTPHCRAVTTVESVFCRVTAPRKLSLRARLSSRIEAASLTPVTVPSGCAADSVEKLTESIDSAVSVSGSSRDLFASTALRDVGTPLYCRGGIRVDTCSPSSPSECRLTGDILITCFFVENDVIRTETVSIPFDEAVALDLPDDLSFDLAACCRGFGSVSSVTIREGDGADTADVTYELFAEVLFSVSGDVVLDAFSTASPSSAEYGELCYSSVITAASTPISVNERTAVSRTGRAELLTGSAVVESARIECNGEKLRLTGSLTGTALISADGERENVPYSVPWSCEIPVSVKDADCETPDYIANVSVLSVSGRADGELSVSAELFVSVSATAPKRLPVLEALSIDGNAEPTSHCIRVCYPTSGERAWDIAKRFRVPVSKVASPANTDENGAPRRVVVI